MGMSVCVREKECVYMSVCVCERERVCVRERECVYMSVCVCERESVFMFVFVLVCGYV